MTRTLTTILAVAMLLVGSVGIGLAVSAPAAPDASSTTLAQENGTDDGNETDGNVTVENVTAEDEEADDGTEMDDNETELGDNETVMGEDENETEMGENVTAEAENASVTFLNQTANGSAVLVNETALPEGGFLVIHLANQTSPGNFSAGPVVGNSSYLEAGTHEGVVVSLNETLEEGQWLIAMPHMDTNDNQTYEFPEADDPYTDGPVPVTDEAYVDIMSAVDINVTEEPTDGVDVDDGAMTDDETMGNETMGNETMDDGTMDNETMDEGADDETMGNETAGNETGEA